MNLHGVGRAGSTRYLGVLIASITYGVALVATSLLARGSWAQAILAAPMLFIVGTGFGLFLVGFIRPEWTVAARLGRVQLLVLAFTVGAVGAGIVATLLTAMFPGVWLSAGVIGIVALVGLVRTAHLWHPRDSEWSEVGWWFAAALPVALAAWWLGFGAVSQYPFTDLFAEVHSMKAAQEYATTGVLNPYVFLTYSDFRSALLGAVAGVFGVDLLKLVWPLRYIMTLAYLVMIFAFVDALFADRGRKWVAFLILALANTWVLLTNGSLAIASTTALVGFLAAPAIYPGDSVSRTRERLIVPAGLMLAFVLCVLLNSYLFQLAAFVVVLVAFQLAVWWRQGAAVSLGRLVAVSGWALAIMLNHRSALLFVPLAGLAWLAFELIRSGFAARALMTARVVWITFIILPVVGAAAIALVVLQRLGLSIGLPDAQTVFSYVTVLVLGQPILATDEISLGLGSDVATIELVRALGPVFGIVAGGLAIWWWWRHPPWRLAALSMEADRDRVVLLTATWSAGCLMTLGILSGFPFFYRSMFLVTNLLAVAVAELVLQLVVEARGAAAGRIRLAGAAVVGLAALLVGCVYAFDPLHLGDTYQALVRPSLVAGVVIAAVAAALMWSASRVVRVASLAACLGSVLAIDRAGMTSALGSYSYGPLPAGQTYVSHYAQDDLDAIAWIRANRPRSLLLSDPYTLGLAKALTGAPTMYLFSNLDTVNPAAVAVPKEIVGAVVSSSSDAAIGVCTGLSSLFGNLSDEAQFQIFDEGSTLAGLARAVRAGGRAPATIEPIKPMSLADLRQRFPATGANGGPPISIPGAPAWSVTLLVNPRTVEWADMPPDRRLSYYPPTGKLQPDVLANMRNGPFSVLEVVNDRTAIVSLNCGEALY